MDNFSPQDLIREIEKLVIEKSQEYGFDITHFESFVRKGWPAAHSIRVDFERIENETD